MEMYCLMLVHLSACQQYISVQKCACGSFTTSLVTKTNTTSAHWREEAQTFAVFNIFPQKYARHFQTLLDFPDISRHFQTLPDISRHCQTLPDIVRRFQTPPNISRHCQTLPSWRLETVPAWLKAFQSGQRQFSRASEAFRKAC